MERAPAYSEVVYVFQRGFQHMGKQNSVPLSILVKGNTFW